MRICDGIETGISYFWKRSKGWKGLNDTPDCHWEYFVEFSGFNGVGGVWIIERSRHNGAGPTDYDGKPWFREQIKSLGWDESKKLINEVLAENYIFPGEL